MKRHLLLVVLAVSLVATPGVVAAAEDPRFEVHVPEPTLTPGETTRVTVQLVNDAADPDERVDPAYDVHARMASGKTPFDVKSGVRLLGTMGNEAQRTVSFTVSVPTDVSSGTYRIPIRLTYRPGGEDERITSTVYATVRVDDRPQFEVLDVQSNVPVGDTGTVSVTMKNVGSQPANDSSVGIQTGSSVITFDGAASTSRHTGAWAVNETRTVTFRAAAASSAKTAPYPATVTVTYDDENGNERRSPARSIGVTPAPEQAFSVGETKSTLRVGEEGDLTVTITNDGPEIAREATIRLAGTGMNVHPLETEIAVGTLAPGDSTTVTFPVEVATSASAGAKQFTFHVTYQNQDDETRQSDPLRTRVQVAPERDQFALDTIDATLTTGASGQLVLAVTNNGDEPVRNVNAKLFTDDPISATDDEAFASSLAPGETKRFTFGVSAAGSALTKTYPVSLDFQYDVDGETKLSKTYTVPVTVERPADAGGLPAPTVVGAAAVLVVAAAAILYWRRR